MAMLAQTNSNNTMQDTSIDQVVKRTIEEVTGNGLNDIRPESDLIEDLGISNAELLNIVKKIQNKLEIELSIEAKQELFEEAEVVQDVVDIIAEEYEF
jgi:acyl carrier protein